MEIVLDFIELLEIEINEKISDDKWFKMLCLAIRYCYELFLLQQSSLTNEYENPFKLLNYSDSILIKQWEQLSSEEQLMWINYEIISSIFSLSIK